MKLLDSPFLQSPRTVSWRRWTFYIHLWLALLLGPVLALVSLTGSIVVFRYELNRLMVPGTAYVTPPRSERLPLDELTARIRAARPADQLSSVSWDGGPSTGMNFWTNSPEGHRIHTFIDPYSGVITGQEDYYGKWMQWFYELHAKLLLGNTGMFLNGFVGLTALIMSISGLIVWWPGLPRWRFGFSFLRGARWQRQNYDWHKLIGFYSSAAVFLIAFTGMYFSFPGLYKSFIQSAAGGKIAISPRARTAWNASTVRLEEFVQTAMRAQPGAQFVSLSFPKKPGDPVSIRTKEVRDWHRIGLNWVYLEPGTGAVICSTRFSDANLASQAALLMYPLHFGRFGGRWGTVTFYAVMVAYVIAGLAPAVLMVTGLLMYWNRSLSKTLGRSRKAAAARIPLEV
ncbi:MAG: PepSY domain-containing protein [Acidobacteria bacterium]|nr:PepSY domain-containing protein [Acidobacteriota bacterium]